MKRNISACHCFPEDRHSLFINKLQIFYLHTQLRPSLASVTRPIDTRLRVDVQFPTCSKVVFRLRAHLIDSSLKVPIWVHVIIIFRGAGVMN